MKKNKYESELEKSSVKASKLSKDKIQSTVKKAGWMVMNIKHIKSISDDISLLIRMVKSSLSKSEFKLDTKAVVIIIGALLYLVSPIDLIPDFLGPIGFTDDISVISIAIKQLSSEIQRFKIFDKQIIDAKTVDIE